MNPGDSVANLVAGVPVMTNGYRCADDVAALTASCAELSTFGLSLHRLTLLLRNGSLRPAQDNQEMLDRRDGGAAAQPGSDHSSRRFQRLPTVATAKPMTSWKPKALPKPDIHQFRPVPSARCGVGKGTWIVAPLARTSRCSWIRRVTSA